MRQNAAAFALCRAQLYPFLHLGRSRLLPAGRQHLSLAARRAAQSDGRRRADLRRDQRTEHRPGERCRSSAPLRGEADRRRGTMSIRSPASSTTRRPRKELAVTSIQWSADDALPFPLCLSTANVDDVSVALGNIALADHGQTDQRGGAAAVLVPNPALTINQPSSSDRCAHPPPVMPKPGALQPAASAVAADVRRRLSQPDGSRYADGGIIIRPVLRECLPECAYRQQSRDPGGPRRRSPGDVWKAAVDLLKAARGRQCSSSSNSRTTAPRRCASATANIGMAPPDGTIFTAHYRVGNGLAGNVGDAIAVPNSDRDGGILSDPRSSPRHQSAERERRNRSGDARPRRQAAPYAFRTQQRAVTETDYGNVAVSLVDPDARQGDGHVPLDRQLVHDVHQHRSRKAAEAVDCAGA